MKRGYKVILIIIGIIVLSELIHIVPNPQFVQSYIDKLNAENRAEIEYGARFAAKASNNLPVNLNLFGSNPDIKFNETLNFINRSPVSKFTYNGKYEIAVCRLDSLYTNGLLNTIKERYIDSDLSFNVNYAIDDIRYITFDYNNSNIKLNESKGIFLNLDGLNTKTLAKNDTIAYYSSSIKSLSIQHGIDGVRDICAKSNSAPGPIQILFLKRNNSLYALFMVAYRLNDHLDPNLLLSLIVNPKR